MSRFDDDIQTQWSAKIKQEEIPLKTAKILRAMSDRLRVNNLTGLVFEVNGRKYRITLGWFWGYKIERLEFCADLVECNDGYRWMPCVIQDHLLASDLIDYCK